MSRTTKRVAAPKTRPLPPRVSKHVDAFASFFGEGYLADIAPTRAGAKRQRGKSLLPERDPIKRVKTSFDAPCRWRACFIELRDLPEWVPRHVLDCPPSLIGVGGEYSFDEAPYRESREAAFRECAEYNAGIGADGNHLRDDGEWCFVVEYGTVENHKIIITSEFKNDVIGHEQISIHRAIRMVPPTRAERSLYDGWVIGAELPDVGDPSMWRVYAVFSECDLRIWYGDFGDEELAKAAAAANREKNDRLVDTFYAVVPPGPLPGVVKLRRMAGCKAEGGGS